MQVQPPVGPPLPGPPAVPGDRAGPDAAAAAPFLVARGVVKRYGPVVALDDVGIELRPGEVVALAGENGSGKSTLARILAGVIPPDAGEVTLDGAPVRFARPRDALDAGIALVSQELTAVPGMSVAENVLLTGIRRPWARINRARMAETARPLLNAVGLAHVHPLTPFGALKQGDREMVEIAKALHTGPRLLILDEATTRLPDPERLFRLVEAYRDRGMATILITHRLREIRRLAGRAVVLRDGRLAGELPGQDLSDERLSAMMVGRELSDFFAKPDPHPGDPVLEVRDLVVDGATEPVTLQVRAGEIVGLAGLVGAGRSELLETVAGARRPRGGEVRVNATPIRPGSVTTALRAGISLVPEDRLQQGMVRDLSIRRNLHMARVRPLSFVDHKVEREDAAWALHRFGIRCRDADAPMRSLSGGNQQKVVLARAVVGAPKVLLLDEPTRGVDIGAKEDIYHIIGDMVARGMAVLMASSDMLELLGLCDRIVVLHERSIAGELHRADATEERIALLSAGGEVNADVGAL